MYPFSFNQLENMHCIPLTSSLSTGYEEKKEGRKEKGRVNCEGWRLKGKYTNFGLDEEIGEKQWTEEEGGNQEEWQEKKKV